MGVILVQAVGFGAKGLRCKRASVRAGLQSPLPLTSVRTSLCYIGQKATHECRPLGVRAAYGGSWARLAARWRRGRRRGARACRSVWRLHELSDSDNTLKKDTPLRSCLVSCGLVSSPPTGRRVLGRWRRVGAERLSGCWVPDSHSNRAITEAPAEKSNDKLSSTRLTMESCCQISRSFAVLGHAGPS